MNLYLLRMNGYCSKKTDKRIMNAMCPLIAFYVSDRYLSIEKGFPIEEYEQIKSYLRLLHIVGDPCIMKHLDNKIKSLKNI